MEKQIREIIAQHVGGTYEAKQKCAEEILLLFSVVGRSEQLVCDKCGYPMFYHKPDDIMYCHGCNNTKPAN